MRDCEGGSSFSDRKEAPILIFLGFNVNFGLFLGRFFVLFFVLSFSGLLRSIRGRLLGGFAKNLLRDGLRGDISIAGKWLYWPWDLDVFHLKEIYSSGRGAI